MNGFLRRHETLQAKLWRYRGVIAVGLVPVFVILLIVVALPRTRPSVQQAGTLHKLQHAVDAGTANPKAAKGSSTATYNIIIDAGSTGSRVHIFKFEGSGKDLSLISDTFHQLKPGLSAYPDDPVKAAESLKPLMEEALKTVPKAAQASTGLSLKATAGLRLLPGDKADRILEAVTSFLKGYPFAVKQGAVGIMDGAHEGAFAWLTLNYLLGKLGRDAAATVAAIDLGGGSVQEAFALTDEQAASAPDGYITQLSGAGKTYKVYVHSYLGYGLMAARARVIEAGKDAEKGHPCFGKGVKLTYSYAGKDYQVAEVTEAGDFKKCAATAFKALEHGKTCGQPQDTCSFSGAWRGKPSKMARVYYASSYFWDRATDAGIIADKSAIEWKTSPGDFAKRADGVCGIHHDEYSKQYAALQAAHAPYFCLDLAFCHTVLTQGFDLPESAHITLVKQVLYKGQTIEAAWPLGAAINDLSSA